MVSVCPYGRKLSGINVCTILGLGCNVIGERESAGKSWFSNITIFAVDNHRLMGAPILHDCAFTNKLIIKFAETYDPLSQSNPHVTIFIVRSLYSLKKIYSSSAAHISGTSRFFLLSDPHSTQNLLSVPFISSG